MSLLKNAIRRANTLQSFEIKIYTGEPSMPWKLVDPSWEPLLEQYVLLTTIYGLCNKYKLCFIFPTCDYHIEFHDDTVYCVGGPHDNSLINYYLNKIYPLYSDFSCDLIDKFLSLLKKYQALINDFDKITAIEKN